MQDKYSAGERPVKTQPPLDSAQSRPAAPLKGWHYLVLLLPYAGLLVPSIYARWTPEFFGVPFFYAYQFAWVFLSAGITGLIFLRIRR